MNGGCYLLTFWRGFCQIYQLADKVLYVLSVETLSTIHLIASNCKLAASTHRSNSKKKIYLFSQRTFKLKLKFILVRIGIEVRYNKYMYTRSHIIMAYIKTNKKFKCWNVLLCGSIPSSIHSNTICYIYLAICVIVSNLNVKFVFCLNYPIFFFNFKIYFVRNIFFNFLIM